MFLKTNFRGVFARAMKDLLINGNGLKTKKLIELENALVDSQTRLTNVETTNEVLRKQVEKVTSKNEELEGKLNNVQEQLDNVTAFIRNLRMRAKQKKLSEVSEIEAEDHAEVRRAENLTGKEQKASDLVKEHWTDEEHWRDLTEEQRETLKRHLKTKNENAK